MSEFLIIPKAVLVSVDNLNVCKIELENQIRILEKIKKNISLGFSTNTIKSELSDSIEKLILQKDSLKMMKKQLQAIADEYTNSEKKIKDNKITVTVRSNRNNEKSDSNGTFNSEDIREALIADLKELIDKASSEAVRGNNLDWKAWFMRYVPQNVSDLTMLGVFDLLSEKGLSEDVITEHKEQNEVAWKEYQESHDDEKYIEHQSDMCDIQYGNHSGDYNTCEVIAAYNALQYLTDGNSPDSFPDLLEQFEEKGITAYGEFGTSPEAVNSYFEENGYNTMMLAEDGISSSNLSDMSNNYDTYILTTYNDKTNLGSMVHTVSITVEDGKYVVHNDYDGTKSYSSLEAAVAGYNDGNGEPISVIGISDK